VDNKASKRADDGADNTEEKLKNLTSAIMADAEDESNAIYEEIEKQSERVMNAGDDEALNEAFRFIKGQIAEIRNDCGRKVSHAMMQYKRELYLRREEMEDEIESAVRERLRAYVKTPAYRAWMVNTAKRLMREFDADMVLYLRPGDEDVKEEIAHLETPHKIGFAPGGFELGGMEAVCPDRKRHIDAAFDSTLHQMRGDFSKLFGLKLSE